MAELKQRCHEIEAEIEKIPDTDQLLPCKLFLRLHFVFGLTMTETAEKMNVSETTLRRIRDRLIRYYDEYPMQ